MSVNWLEAHAQVFSVYPVLDEELATAAGQAYASSLTEAHPDGRNALQELRLRGLLSKVGDSWRIPDPLRADLQKRLATSNMDVFRQVAAGSAEVFSNGRFDLLKRVLGQRNAEISLRVLQLVANPGDHESFDGLVRTVEVGTRLGRRADELAVVRQLQSYPVVQFDREIRFFEGMIRWRRADHQGAANLFARVVEPDLGDRAEAIARHLLGIHLFELNQSEDALRHIDRAIQLLRNMGDQLGVALTLTTLGKLLTISFEQTRDLGTLEAAIRALEEARRISVGIDAVFAGSASTELAVAYELSGDHRRAILMAEESVSALRDETSARGFRSRVILAGMYRDSGRVEDAVRLLDESIALGRAVGIADLQFATLLNVLASSEIAGGNLQAAIGHARESVRIGRKIDNGRHIAHATHTLARALLAQATTVESLVEIFDLLTESLRLLERIGDLEGARRVQRTIGQMEKRRFELTGE